MGKTNGKKSTEFWFSIGVVLLGLVVIGAEIGVKMLNPDASFGIDIQKVFYVIFGTGFGYTGSRTITKSRTMTSMDNQKKIELELEKAQIEAQSNVDINSVDPFGEDFTGEDLSAKDETTRMPLVDSFSQQEGFRVP